MTTATERLSAVYAGLDMIRIYLETARVDVEDRSAGSPTQHRENILATLDAALRGLDEQQEAVSRLRRDLGDGTQEIIYSER